MKVEKDAYHVAAQDIILFLICNVECVLAEVIKIALHAMELALKDVLRVEEEVEAFVCIVEGKVRSFVLSVKAKENPSKNVPIVTEQQRYSNRSVKNKPFRDCF